MFFACLFGNYPATGECECHIVKSKACVVLVILIV